jgi:Cu+-exporting ATPase
MGTSVDFDITGMTCASCAARIQKKVNQLPGAEGAVNYATGSARVELDESVCSPDDVITVIDGLGYGASVHADEPEHGPHHASAGDLRARLLVAAPLAAAVMVLAMAPGLHGQPWAAWAAVVVSAPVVWWSGWPIHHSNLRGLRHRSVGMDTLVSLGAAVAWIWSVYTAAFGGGEVYAEVSAVVITFVLLGRWLEARATDTSVDAVAALSRLQVDRVTLLEPGGGEAEVPLSRLRVGDRFVVRPGERVATDGVVESGHTAVDLSLVTGESVPVEVAPGSEVVGGSVNGSGRVVVRAGAVGSDTVLARIAALVKAAQSGKAPIERLVDAVAGVFVPIVIALALLTLAGWLVAGADPSFAIGAAVAVLVIACPCALGLATPTALVAGTGRGAQLGVLIRGPQVLEAARAVDTVVLDKTGTVTSGRISVVDVVGGTAEEHRRIAAVESHSEHPIGRAIAAGLGGGGNLPEVTGFAAEPGVGAAGVVDGSRVRVVKIDQSLRLPSELAAAVTGAQRQGLTPVAALIDGRPVAVIVVGDALKPSSRAAVRRLADLGLDLVLLTGDRRSTAEAVARDAGIPRVIADVAPEQKVDAVRALQSQGKTVAMVGDGINDAAALASADLGIAMGTGTDAAREAADITIVNSDLESVADAVSLSRRTWRTIQQNLVWAFGYNVAAVPLAMSGRLSPMIASAAMAASSVLVVGNSLRLRGFRSHSATRS